MMGENIMLISVFWIVLVFSSSSIICCWVSWESRIFKFSTVPRSVEFFVMEVAATSICSYSDAIWEEMRSRTMAEPR